VPDTDAAEFESHLPLKKISQWNWHMGICYAASGFMIYGSGKQNLSGAEVFYAGL